MITLTVNRFKGTFFDRDSVQRAVDKAQFASFDEGSSSALREPKPNFRSKPVSLGLLPISGRRSRERPRDIDGRARKWRAERLRVSALPHGPKLKSRVCVLRRAYGGLRPKLERTDCARGGLPCFNLGGPAEWRGQVSGRPSRACSRVVSLLSDCAHRETARPERSLVHSSSGRKHAGRENRAGSRKDWTTRLPCSDDRARSSLVA